MSIRALAEKYKVHRRTVRQALGEATPPARKVPVRDAPILGEHVETVRGWLVADKDVHRKQRHTARRVWQRLVQEQGVVVAESSVRGLVAELRRDIFDQSLGGSPASAFLVRLMLGQVWTTPERDAVATSLGLGQRRRIVNHYAAPGRGAQLRTAFIWHLLANGHTVRFKAGADALDALYQHELQANATLLSEAGVTVHHIRGRTWELRPSV